MSSVTSEASSQRHKIKFHGAGDSYFGLWLVNVFLSVITLGIYSAWAKVRTRRFFYGNTELAGDRFDYHAKPMQILIGRILVILGIVVFYVCLYSAEIVALVLALCFLALLPWIIVRNWRFQAIMSSYRGVRFNYHPRIGRACIVFFVLPVIIYCVLLFLFMLCSRLMVMGAISQIFLAIMTFIVLSAFIAVNGIINALSYDLYVNNMFFGDAAFKGEMRKNVFVKFSLFATLISLPFLILAVVAISSFIYDVFMISLTGNGDEMLTYTILANSGKLILAYILLLAGGMVVRAYLIVVHRNYMFNQTSLNDGKIKLHSSMKVMPYLWLLFVNTLIIIFTLGLGTPFAHVRHARYMLETIEVEGDVESLAIHAHSDTARSAVAEELVQMMDINVAL